MAKILIIDDDKMICKTMSRVFVEMGHDFTYTLTLGEGVKKVRSGDFDVVFLDVRLPDGNGLQQLPYIQLAPSSPEVIILTGYADPDGAELAIKNNVWDYLKKPASIDSVTLALTRALQYREAKKTSDPTMTLKREGIIGNSPGINTCLDLVARAANSNTNIFIIGETGTGKELFAKAIHANSSRARSNFVVIDCGALPENLMVSYLFGHKKGAFTGADRDTEGRIKHADGGTLFLDEVGEIPISMQKVFLRVLQERHFHPIGGKQEIASDFRLISSSNRNFDEMVKTGQFREDLLFRLRAITINLPPLRERVEDIKELSIHYIKMRCEAQEIGIKGFSPELFEVLELYSWPGNVRELYSTLDWVFARALHEPTLFPVHLPHQIRINVARSSLYEESPNRLTQEKSEGSSEKLPNWKDFRKSYIAEGEKRYLQDLLLRTGGNINRASQLSGLSQPRLYELLRKHKISTRLSHPSYPSKPYRESDHIMVLQ